MQLRNLRGPLNRHNEEFVAAAASSMSCVSRAKTKDLLQLQNAGNNSIGESLEHN